MRIHKLFHLLVIAIVLLQSLACSNAHSTDFENEKNKILELLELERKYHLEKLASELVNLQSDDFTTINAGEVFKPTKEEGIDMFSNYFSSVEFINWDDIAPPVIKFSEDLTVAYVTVQKKVVIKYVDEIGEQKQQATDFAWVSIYRKVEGVWKLDLIASTNKQLLAE